MNHGCQSCDKGMNSADNTRICRIHGRLIDPASMLALFVEHHGCKDFAREPGEDSEEAELMRGLCPVVAGRGD